MPHLPLTQILDETAPRVDDLTEGGTLLTLLRDVPRAVERGDELIDGRLRRAVDVVQMIQNLIWATGYNVIALPLAAGALYAWGARQAALSERRGTWNP